MPEIIKALRRLGGHATTKELKYELLENSEIIPADYMQLDKKSRNGRTYKPFNYTFNFSITNLEFADLLVRPFRGSVELTKLGRQLELSKLNIDGDIRSKADVMWQKRHEENLAKKALRPEDVVDEETSEKESATDQWRTALIEAISKFSPAKFELFARLLVKKMGVDLDESMGVKLSGDGGIDGFGYLTADDFRTARVAI